MITETMAKVAAAAADDGLTAQQLHQHRPQSPRHFFEKLYGHRETHSANTATATTTTDTTVVGTALPKSPDAFAEHAAGRSVVVRPQLNHAVCTPGLSPTSSNHSSTTGSEEGSGASGVTADNSDAR